MASPVNPIAGSDPVAAGSAPTPKPSGLSASPDVFMQLLVAQIKNQDPLNPTDSVQFVSQLAQFSQLEQVVAIRKDIESQQTNTGATTTTNGDTAATQRTNL